MTKQRRTFGGKRLPNFGRIAAILSILLGLATSFAPGFAARSAHVDEASLVSATAEICALSHHGSDSGHSRDDGCCCLQATARRDPTLFVAIFGVVEFVAPDTLSFAARSDASQRAGVARPTTPWLSRAPPSFS